MNLLIVDDHPTNLKLLRAQLESEGHAVFEAHDGVDALALLERQRVDVVISDILMPRMDGYRLCYEIRKHARLHDLPIILCTSTYTSPGDEKLVLDVGADKYLKRPVSLETLVAALREVIAMPHAAPQPKALQEIDVLKKYSERLVSKLKEKNTELQAAEVKFRALVEQSIVGIYIIQDERFVYVNPGMQKIFGWSEAEMTSRTVSDFVVPEDQALARENIRQRISGEVPSLHYYLRMLHQSGTVLQVEVYGSRADYIGRPAVMGTLLDITTREQAEAALRATKQQLRALVGRLHTVREEEAKRIARELHDDLGQHLTTLNMELDGLEMKLPDATPNQRNQIARMHTVVDHTIEVVQKISGELRLGQLDVFGLTAAIDWQLKEFSRRSAIPCRIMRLDEIANLSDAQNTVIFRILQEALTNIVRHAGATVVEVSLQAEPDHLTLRVRDNGRGITAAELNAAKAIGLLGMRERAQLVGGDVTITGGAGVGTTVLVRIPLNRTGAIPA